MPKYFLWALLTIALASSTASNADQITIINKLNLPSKCNLLWDQDSAENTGQISDQQIAQRTSEKVSLITRLNNDPTPQTIKIPSIPGYKVTGFRIACDSIVYPTVVNGHEEGVSLASGKAYILEKMENKKIFITQN